MRLIAHTRFALVGRQTLVAPRVRSALCGGQPGDEYPLLGSAITAPAPNCSLSKYGFRASGVRTGESAHRAETGLLPTFLRSVQKRPSQEVRRDLASGERFSGFPAPGQSTGLPRKPQETCRSARRSVRRRARLVWELADRVGFEPTVGLHLLRFSRPTRSTTPPPVRTGGVIVAPASGRNRPSA